MTSFQLSPGKRAFLSGTLLLTATGFLCRVLGFFYRIFLSRTIGAEGLGIYNLVHPVYGICFALCAGSMQTALSQLIASKSRNGRHIFFTGLSVSLALSFLLAWGICRSSHLLSVVFLMEERCQPYLYLMAVSVPFAALHACINGYYYGMQKARIPAFSQIAEQVFRMIIVFLLAASWTRTGRPITVSLAVLGHLAGEAAAAFFTLLCFLLFPPQPAKQNSPVSFSPQFHALMALALPLMGNRLILNILSCAEAVWIPNCLELFGLSSFDAFSLYGVLTGMALPFILFPSAITNSMAVLLLPKVARAQSQGRPEQIAASISLSIRCSLAMGIFCIGAFVLFGMPLGSGVFHDPTAGTFIQILSWLCPFLYLATTMGSILNGLGHTRITFLQNAAAISIRILFVLFGIPRFGIRAYLTGMLVSELSLASMHLISLRRRISFSWNAWSMVVLPALILFISIGLVRFVCTIFPLPDTLPLFFSTTVQIGELGLFYCAGLFLFHLI